jgi:AcrR family transcriptional regulator
MATDTQKKLKRDERRESIIAGAAQAFVQHGYEATSLDDVASASQVSRALLYRHFDTKKAIYEAVLKSFVETLHHTRDVAEQENAEPTPNTLEGLILAAQTNPNGFRLFFRHSSREPDFREYYDNLTSRRISYIEERLLSTYTDPKKRHFHAELLQDLVINTLLIWIDNDMPDPDKMLQLISGILKSVI